MLSDNERHLFFQNPGGVIHRMIYTAEKNQWTADSTAINISDAKLLTPMAANAQIQSDGSQRVVLLASETLRSLQT